MSVSNKSLCHLGVEAKLTVLEAGQDQALEADYELLHGVGQRGSLASSYFILF